MDYENAYNACIEIMTRGLNYYINEIIKSERYDGYMLRGDKWSIEKLADVCEKYGFDTVNMIALHQYELGKRIAEHEKESD